jgi:hypothetical protein
MKQSTKIIQASESMRKPIKGNERDMNDKGQRA